MKLQKLKIPPCWQIVYNEFYEIEPTKENVESIELWFKEDLLQLKSNDRNTLIDLGWYPEGNFEEGKYKLVEYKQNYQGKLLFEYETKSKDQIVEKVNELLSKE